MKSVFYNFIMLNPPKTHQETIPNLGLIQF